MITTYVVIAVAVVLFIAMCFFAIWLVGIVVNGLFGDIIEHYIKVRECRKNWDNKRK